MHWLWQRTQDSTDLKPKTGVSILIPQSRKERKLILDMAEYLRDITAKEKLEASSDHSITLPITKGHHSQDHVKESFQ